jgi:ABC-type amino acid transport system permease subunit
VGISDLNLRVLIPYLPMLGWGALRTLEISVLALLLSFPLGLVGALMRVADNRVARAVATVYVETVRNIPLLVLRTSRTMRGRCSDEMGRLRFRRLP